MQLKPDGTFDVQPRESINFEVRRPSPPCVADFSPEGWASASGVSEPDSTSEAEACMAPEVSGSRCVMAITVSFSPDVKDEDDNYTVTINGMVIDVFNPPTKINGNVYKFHVS